jgi:hypothetical protein
VAGSSFFICQGHHGNHKSQGSDNYTVKHKVSVSIIPTGGQSRELKLLRLENFSQEFCTIIVFT